jgi:excisionase family DNA binding protein
MLTYEIHGISEDGSIFAIVAAESKSSVEFEGDAEAYWISEEYAKLWAQAAEVKLYRTPRANFGSISSLDLWPGQVYLITTIPCCLCEPRSSSGADLEDDVPF